MLNQYTLEPEFKFQITGKKIETIHSPISGKRSCLFEVLKSPDNIYGIQLDINILQAEVDFGNQENLEGAYQEALLSDDADKIIKTLNYIYLKEDYYFLILCLYHKSYLVRKNSFTLLCSGFEINPLVLSFFQAAFNFNDPYQTLVFPENLRNDCQNYLNREFVRWLTSLYLQTSKNKIWQRYNPQEIIQAIETQKKSNFITVEATLENSNKQIINSKAIELYSKDLNELPKEGSEIIVDSSNPTSDKSNTLKNKWFQASNKLKTSHKFLERLFEKWEEKKSSEFANALMTFLSYLTYSERYIFFIYGASSLNINAMSLSYKYILEISPLNAGNLVSLTKEDAQKLVSAIIHSKYFGESKNNELLFRTINQHFDELIINLKEVDNIFIPVINETDIQKFIPEVETTSKLQVRKLNYPHQKGFFKSFHFDPGKISNRFSQQLRSEPNSALEIQSISGIAIVLSEHKTRSTPLPLNLPDYDFKAIAAFKPSNKFDPKYFKINKNKLKANKAKTLADIFGDSSTEEEEDDSPVTLEQILNNKNNKGKTE